MEFFAMRICSRPLTEPLNFLASRRFRFYLFSVVIAFAEINLAICQTVGPSTSEEALNRPAIAGHPNDPNASASTRAVDAYLTSLSLGSESGVIAGQNIGDAATFDRNDGLFGYPSTIDPLQAASGEVPGMVGVEYEYAWEATPGRLLQLNRYLKDYWNQGGLVTINFSPVFPVRSTADTDRVRADGVNLGNFKLLDLIDSGKAIHKKWYNSLYRIADALSDLQDAGVVVLWRPMQEMNGDWFWWASPNGEDYAAVWQDMYRFFTMKRNLHNLLWVFSPSATPSDGWGKQHIRPFNDYYPGNAYVDVVAGTSYNDSLDIPDYVAFRQYGKPLGAGEYGTAFDGELSRTGSLDTTQIRDRLLSSYPAVAFWVSYHSWANWEGKDIKSYEYQSLFRNRNFVQLLQDPSVITRSRVTWRKFLSP